MKIVVALFASVLAIALSIDTWMNWPFYEVRKAVRVQLGDPSAEVWGVTINGASQAACGYVRARRPNVARTLRTHFVLLHGAELHLKPWETGMGTPQQLLEAAQRQVAYVYLAKKNCASDKK